MLKVHIIDNGLGIKPNDIKKLFKMFGKLRRTSELNSEGIGMGLMICQKLVELNGGEIQAFSDGKKKGSVFSFTMKMQMPTFNAKRKILKARHDSEKRGETSDEESFLGMIQSNLSSVDEQYICKRQHIINISSASKDETISERDEDEEENKSFSVEDS